MQARERIFINMQIFGDDLFANYTPAIPPTGLFFPVTFVKRQNDWTQAQADEVFGPLILGMKLKWSFFGILLGIGFILLGFCVWYGLKFFKMKNELGIHWAQPEHFSVLKERYRMNDSEGLLTV